MITTSVVSQVIVRPGVRLGLNYSNVSSVDNTKSKLGFNEGLFVNLHLSDLYELQVETLYSSQEAKLEVPRSMSSNSDSRFNEFKDI